MNQTNGLITHDDLRAYQAKERAPPEPIIKVTLFITPLPQLWRAITRTITLPIVILPTCRMGP